MITTYDDILGILLNHIDENLTIHQISKLLKKSYAYTNSHVRQLISDGLLNKQVVGKAIVCSLNMDNDETISYLIKDSYKKKSSAKLTLELQKLKSVLDEYEFYYCLYESSGKYFAIVNDKESTEKNLDSKKIFLQTKQEFQLTTNKLKLKEVIIIEGHELFWNLTKQMIN